MSKSTPVLESGEKSGMKLSGPLESEPTSALTSTHEGQFIVEQLQASMATSSELVGKAAQAVEDSAAATTRLQATVKDKCDNTIMDNMGGSVGSPEIPRQPQQS